MLQHWECTCETKDEIVWEITATKNSYSKNILTTKYCFVVHKELMGNRLYPFVGFQFLFKAPLTV